jgi:lysophospholipase L1-like esterase
MKKLLLVLTFSLLAVANADSPKAIEAYGDSLTAGFLSTYSIDSPPPLKTISTTLSDLARFVLTKDRKYTRKYEDKDLAWVTQVAKKLGVPADQIHNHAFTGARGFDLMEQVNDYRGPTEATAAFFLIGHNDICKDARAAEVLGEDVAEHYLQALQKWDQNHRGATAYLLPVANVDQVFDELDKVVWYKSDQTEYSCRESWEVLFPYCPRYTLMRHQGTLREFLRDRIESINSHVESLVKNWKSTRNNQLEFVRDGKTFPLKREYFAIDCYHLSETGQRAVGDHLASFLSKPVWNR